MRIDLTIPKLQSFFQGLIKGSTSSMLCAFFALGLLTTILIPPFQVPDEPTHWIAAYERTTLRKTIVIGRNGRRRHCALAKSLPSTFEPGRIAFRTNEKISGREFKNVETLKAACDRNHLNYGLRSTYPGVALARIVTTGEAKHPYKALQFFYLSRLFQGALVGLLIWRLVSAALSSNGLTPGLATMMAIALAPLFIQQSFAISADTVTFCLSLSLAFFMLFMSRANKFDWAILAFLAITVSATKPPLFLMIPAFLYAGLIKARSILGENKPIFSFSWPLAFMSHLTIVLALVAAAWISLDQPVSAKDNRGRGGSNVQNQLEFITNNPAQALSILSEATWNKFASWEPYVGSLGWLDTQLSGWTQKRYRHLFLLSFAIDLALALFNLFSHISKASIRELFLRRILGLGLTATLFLSGFTTSLIIYLTWTPAGMTAVAGLQARYFLPMLLPLPLVIGQLFSWEMANVSERHFASRVGLLIGVALFAFMALMLFFPLFLDLILRWW